VCAQASKARLPPNSSRSTCLQAIGVSWEWQRGHLLVKSLLPDSALLRIRVLACSRAAVAQLHPEGPAAAAVDHERAEAEHRARALSGPPGSLSLPLRSLLTPETVTTGDSEERAADGGDTDLEGYSSFSGADAHLAPPVPARAKMLGVPVWT